MKFAVNQYGLAHHYGDPAAIVRTAQLAESAGFDQFVVTDHVVMGEQVDQYPYGPWPTPLDFPWWEPMTVMAVVAGATRSLRLSTGVLLSTLRPAALLAKQAATLDQLSGGRLELGIGVGWQKTEFDAVGVEFSTRKARFIEQIRVMKRLWTEECVTFQGEFHHFDRVYCHPQPWQQGGVPLYVGIAPSDSNLPWIAELADGWLPIDDDPAVYGPLITRVKEALRHVGRDPGRFTFRARLPIALGVDGQPSLRATFERLPEIERAGINQVEVYPIAYLRTNDVSELEDLMAQCGEFIGASRRAAGGLSRG